MNIYIKELEKVSKMTTKELNSNLELELTRYQYDVTKYYKIQALKAELSHREVFKR